MGLENFLEVAKLSRSTRKIKQTASDFLPGLYLRLGQDQKCYDILKEKCEGELEEIYLLREDGAHMTPVNAANFSVAHAAMLCVLKLRILRDLRDLDQADMALGNKHPAELFIECRFYLIGEATRMDSARVEAIDKREDLDSYMQDIEDDLLDLRVYIDLLEPNYLHSLKQPETYRNLQLTDQPEHPITEALVQTYYAWAETPGAFAIFQEILKS